jgi:hypothetical protein
MQWPYAFAGFCTHQAHVQLQPDLLLVQVPPHAVAAQ